MQWMLGNRNSYSGTILQYVRVTLTLLRQLAMSATVHGYEVEEGDKSV